MKSFPELDSDLLIAGTDLQFIHTSASWAQQYKEYQHLYSSHKVACSAVNQLARLPGRRIKQEPQQSKRH